jgi:hypothetical protein
VNRNIQAYKKLMCINNKNDKDELNLHWPFQHCEPFLKHKN